MGGLVFVDAQLLKISKNAKWNIIFLVIAVDFLIDV